MFVIRTFLVVFFAFYSASASELQIDGNAFVDNILITLRTRFLEKVDPIVVPNVTEQREIRLFGIGIKAGFSLFNGQIRGASNLERVGNTTVETLPSGKLAVVANLGLKNLSVACGIRYEWIGNIVKINESGSVLAKVEDIQVLAKFAVKPDFLQPGLQSLNLVKISGLKVKFEGLGHVGNVLNALSDEVTKRLNFVIVSTLEGTLDNTLNEILNSE